MKKIPALIAAVVTTFVVGCLMAVMAVNALLNPNTVQASNSSNQPQQIQPLTSSGIASTTGAASTSGAAGTSGDAAAQVKQLQDLVSQYQAREKQYQSQLDQARQRLQQANTQIQQANQQVQQYQNLLGQLQQMGIIRVDSNGQILVPSFRGFGGGGGFGDGD